MLDCPFCKAPYDTENLIDGRCPSCGGIVKWTSDEADGPTITPMVTVNLGPSFLGNSLNRPIENLKVPESRNEKAADRPDVARSMPVQVADPGHGSPAQANQPAMPIPSNETDPQHQRSLSTDDISQLGGIWNVASAKTDSPFTTLRTTSGEQSQAIDVVINERRFQNAPGSGAAGMDYEILQQIGRGAVGVVYAAQQNSINRNVAVKMLNTESSANEEQKDKFLFEAIITGDLDHPNIVPIHELGKNQDGDLFYSMKQVVGTPWSETLATKSLTENLEVLLKVCDAVSFAHARGIVHRDLKPENTMLGEFGEVLVVDWGIALPCGGFSKMAHMLPKPGISGTPAYMAPEMATGPLSKIGPHSDIYLLGAMLYEIVTGTAPHVGKTVMDCVIAAANNWIAPTAETGELVDIALRAMATEPEDRYASTAELKGALHAYQSHIESITLTERAQQGLNQAEQSNDYQDYSRALFAFQEALDLWGGNTAARSGLRAVNLGYAACALKKGDFELGLSLVDTSDPGFQSIHKSLRAGLEERNRRQARVRLLQMVSVALLLVLIGGGIAFSLSLNQAKVKAVNAAEVAKNQTTLAIQAKEEMEDARNDEKAARDNADRLAGLEKAQREEAQKSQRKAMEEKLRANQASIEAARLSRNLAVETYYAEIGSITEKVGQNAFTSAREILSAISDKEASRGLGVRHWEWGRLNQLCNGSNQQRINGSGLRGAATTYPINALAFEPDSNLLAIGSVLGQVDIVDLNNPDPATNRSSFDVKPVDGKATIHSLAFVQNGSRKQLLASGSIDAKGLLATWDLPIAKGAQPVIIDTLHPQAITCLCASAERDRLLTGSEDMTLKLWQLSDLKSGLKVPLQTFSGHNGTVWDCDFDPDRSSSRFVSCSADTTVRLWSCDAQSTDSSECRRFLEHSEPVYQARFSRDGKQIVSAGQGRRILLWTIETSSFPAGELQAEIKRRLDRMQSRTAAGDAEKNAADWRFATSDSRQVGQHDNSIHVLEFSPNGDYLLSAGDDNIVHIWDLESGLVPDTGTQTGLDPIPFRSFRGHGSWVRGARFGPQVANTDEACPAYVYSGGYDQEVFKFLVDKLPPTDDILFQQAITAGAVSPRGDEFVIGVENGAVETWRLGTAGKDQQHSTEQSQVLNEGHQYLCSRAVFTPDRSRMLTAAGDNSVVLWDVQRGVQLRRIGDTGRRSLLSISSDGEWFATGEGRNEGQGGAIKVFSMRGGLEGDAIRLVPTLDSLSGSQASIDFSTIALSSNGEFLVAGDLFGRCYLWRVPEQILLGSWRAHAKSVVDVVVLPDSPDRPGELSLLSAGQEGTVMRWTLADRGAAVLPGDEVQTVSLTGGQQLSGMRLAASSQYSLNRLVVNASGTTALLVMQERVQAVRNESGVAQVTTPDAYLRLVNMAGEELATARLPQTRVSSATFDSQGTEDIFLAVNQPEASSKIYRWRPTDDDAGPQAFVDTKKKVMIGQLGVSTDAKEIFLAWGKGIEFWNYQTRQTRTLRPHERINCVVYSPDGELVLSGGVEGAAKVWNASRSELLFKIETPGLSSVTAVSFAPHGPLLMLATEDGNVYRYQYDLESNSVEPAGAQPICNHAARINGIVPSPDDRYLLTAGSDKKVCVWDLQTGTERASLMHEDQVLCLAFSPDGQLVLSGCGDNQAYLWETSRWEQADGAALQPDGRLSGHAAQIASVQFSMDRLRALTASRDGTAKLWDLTEFLQRPTEAGVPRKFEFREVMTLAGHEKQLVAAQFATHGHDILTVGGDSKAVVWRGTGSIPLAIGLSQQYPEQWTVGSFKLLDDRAVVLCPSHPHLETAGLTMEVFHEEEEAREFTAAAPEELADAGPLGTLEFVDHADRPGSIQIEDGKLFWLPWDGGRQTEIGSIVEHSATRIRIAFNVDANASAIEQLIRSIGYRYDEPLEENVEISRYVGFDLQSLDPQVSRKTWINVRVVNGQ